MTVFVADVNMFRPEFLPDINGMVLNISESASVGTLLMELKVCPEQIHKKTSRSDIWMLSYDAQRMKNAICGQRRP